ncbi:MULTISPECIES: ABC transporter permease [Hyphobacterium]|uniref:ABC transporter permease n=1 Tax=Hyphobacterium vulgare TaxID=1736751 RepID=A0ABV6ZWG3_9PROT
MRAIYLIARREYLSYVATWGFWLSLLSVPLFMLVGGGLPALIEGSQPTRHYVMVDETGAGYGDALRAAFADAGKSEALSALRAAAEPLGREDRLPAAEAALNAEPGLEGLPEAVEALGLPASSVSIDGTSRFIEVDPPARDAESLRPYLLGEQTIATEEGDQPLFAAIIIRNDSASPVGISIDYWSASLTDTALRNRVQDRLSDILRERRLAEAGVPRDLLNEINAIGINARELNPERTGEAAEVSAAERIPFGVGIAMAFILWTVIFSVVNMLLTAMIEERGNKVLEVLLASARFHEILIGKLMGVAAVSATLLVFWGGLGMLGLVGIQTLLGAADLPVADIVDAVLDPGILLPAFGYFIIGYLMYGAVFLAIGSLCDTLQEAQTLMSPIMLVMFIPLFVVMAALQSPDSTVVQIVSWIPIWTPFVMIARIPSDPPMWELLATTGLMVGFAIVVIALAGVVFRQGALGRANADSVRKLLKLGKKKPA